MGIDSVVENELLILWDFHVGIPDVTFLSYATRTTCIPGI